MAVEFPLFENEHLTNIIAANRMHSLTLQSPLTMHTVNHTTHRAHFHMSNTLLMACKCSQCGVWGGGAVYEADSELQAVVSSDAFRALVWFMVESVHHASRNLRELTHILLLTIPKYIQIGQSVHSPSCS